MKEVINKTKEYDFKEAWDGLLNNSIATSVVTKISYKLDKRLGGVVKLKFYNKITAMWQSTEYICTNEMLSKWYITENVKI
ncbi:hypothetical protein [Clostridium paraputrificum]|uniref:hypothetical protein n=1 Tax=Clostridium paraputrificum TaxID=29363 RepID=UPI00189D8DAD|nr:hypothetical protein [Clostridium paraputrificum]